MLNSEALVRRIFTCQTNKFGKILNQGRAQIHRELDLFNFLKKQRETQVTLNVITPLYKRRLINKQVKAGLLVAPLSKPRGEITKGGELWDSDMEETSSDEDFDYLKW